MKLFRWVSFKIRWWKWLLWDSPNVGEAVLNDWDKESRRIIYDRHEAKEPKP